MNPAIQYSDPHNLDAQGDRRQIFSGGDNRPKNRQYS